MKFKKDQILFSSKGGRPFTLLAIALLIFMLSGCANYADDSKGIALFGGTRLVALDNGICQDIKTKKMWLIEKSKRIGSLSEAKKYTSSLKAGGYNDWRLPTVAELYELYMLFDLHQNGTCRLQVEGTYWSGEADNEGRVGAWELDDNCDPERQYIPKKRGYVRAIRSEQQ